MMKRQRHNRGAEVSMLELRCNAGAHQEGIAIRFVIVEVLLSECDEREARGGRLDGLFDAQVDDREIIIRAARKRAEKNSHEHSVLSERMPYRLSRNGRSDEH